MNELLQRFGRTYAIWSNDYKDISCTYWSYNSYTSPAYTFSNSYSGFYTSSNTLSFNTSGTTTYNLATQDDIDKLKKEIAELKEMLKDK